MVRNRLRALLDASRFCIGPMVQIPSEIVVEVLAYAGFDYAILDLEHTSYDVERVENLVRAAQSAQMPSFVRLWGVDPYLIAKTLDTGVEGLMFPKVSSAAEAEEIVKYTRLAPEGARGVCPETRSGRYFMMPLDEYDRLASETVIAVMIETKEGLENVEEILSVGGVDLVVVGPYDLAYSLGVRPDDKLIAEAQEIVLRAAEAKGVHLMQVAYTVDDIGARLDRHGKHRIFWYRTDNMIIADALRSITGRCEALGFRQLAD